MGIAIPLIKLIGIEVGEMIEFGESPDQRLTDMFEDIYRRVLEITLRWHSAKG